eukprot:2290737-Pyramimonas_sp.AAC.1
MSLVLSHTPSMTAPAARTASFAVARMASRSYPSIAPALRFVADICNNVLGKKYSFKRHFLKCGLMVCGLTLSPCGDVAKTWRKPLSALPVHIPKPSVVCKVCISIYVLVHVAGLRLAGV